jgi:hypothetical protein
MVPHSTTKVWGFDLVTLAMIRKPANEIAELSLKLIKIRYPKEGSHHVRLFLYTE